MPASHEDEEEKAAPAPSAAAHLAGLSDRQKLFVGHLASDPKRNATRAAERAGVPKKGAHVWASRQLKNAKVRGAVDAEVDAALVRTRVRTDRYLLILDAIASIEASDVYNTDGTIKPLSEWPQRAQVALASIDVDSLVRRKGTIVKEQHSEQLALSIEVKDGELGGDALPHTSNWVGQTKTLKFHSKPEAIRMLLEHLKVLGRRAGDLSENELAAKSVNVTVISYGQKPSVGKSDGQGGGR